ncbi:NAD(P)-binding protein [Aspergillus sclerotioniger CBS 115572]|uniref:NAD(P)-binding protein n=1 Tax=Aspergillus sclerotioniger CBS 115572 TaxID=1450535 RepID=A0A317WQA8_9EURO|nr:NAD(P)-binding protein [Aspergillus sclerotioniger CBS 115572]PWY88609.1 NAD(P)-binding protein [Aspergillus sclerotioniger CBS 115572]
MTAASSTWLITGASSGLGKSLVLEALKAGHRVIGTTRDITKAKTACPEFSAKGGIWMELDPAQKDAQDQFAKCAQEYDVDVLVNNAGYAFIGGVEDTSEIEVRDQMEVNFYGPLRAVRGCLPVMRAKGSGHIVLISSGAGFIARPGRGTYSASKFAIEAMHESLSHEVRTLGIKILIVEPGAFRTPFSSRILTPALFKDGFSEGYKGTAVEQMISGSRQITSISDFAKGDPDKAAQAIIQATATGYDFLRMPLGTDCVVALETKIGELQRDLEATRSIAASTDAE